mmetsp:Transcript_13896/g.32810  ORF Transcript_13896/g.32810 Transcript_13896/m.32810 type:complete len:240 (+) Transcript_13896:237-956(+)
MKPLEHGNIALEACPMRCRAAPAVCCIPAATGIDEPPRDFKLALPHSPVKRVGSIPCHGVDVDALPGHEPVADSQLPVSRSPVQRLPEVPAARGAALIGRHAAALHQVSADLELSRARGKVQGRRPVPIGVGGRVEAPRIDQRRKRLEVAISRGRNPRGLPLLSVPAARWRGSGRICPAAVGLGRLVGELDEPRHDGPLLDPVDRGPQVHAKGPPSGKEGVRAPAAEGAPHEPTLRGRG